jgi:tRNA (guanosine-2'-O-)-methyltransferase
MRGPGAGNAARLHAELPSPVPEHPLDARITAQRARNYRQVLARRTARLAVVIEDSYDPHNATAILRTCDAMGIHRVVVTTARNGFKVNPQVSQGVHRYLDLRVLPDIDAAAAWLKPQGYRLWITDLAADAATGPQALEPELARAPLALVFGNEGHGISDRARALADGRFLLPMSGFSQSLNLSVTVAMTLQALRGAAVAADAPGDLPPAEQIATYDAWVRAYAAKPDGGLPGSAGSPAVGRHHEPLEEYRAG